MPDRLDPRFGRHLLRWYDRESRSLPWRDDRDPYRIWVSEIMLQQTTVKAVQPYFERFIRAFPSLESLAGADLNQVLSLWSGLGYYNRARNMHKAARMVMERFDGALPKSYDDMVTLPGIGRYTAGAILSISHGLPLPVVDGNVRRVLARQLAIEKALDGPIVESLWTLLDATVRSQTIRPRVADFNQALMELGALVCTVRRPDCRNCPVSSSCRGLALGIAPELPLKQPRRATVEIHYSVAVIPRRGGRYLMRQNREDTFLSGFWDFPRLETSALDDAGEVPAFLEVHGLHLRMGRRLGQVRHQITFRKLRFHPFLAAMIGAPPAGFRWVAPGQDEHPVAAPVGKILAALPT